MKGNRSGRLRSKIIAWSFAPTAIVLVAVALVTVYAYQQVTGELVMARDEELIRLSASQLVTNLGDKAAILESLARSSELYGGEAPAQREALRQAGNRLVVFDGGVVLLDTFGRVAATEPERPDILGQDWSSSPYYQKALGARAMGVRQAIYSDIVPDGPGGANVVVVSVPINGPQNQLRGLLAGMFRIGPEVSNPLYADLIRLRAGESGSYVVDGEGRAIFHSQLFRIGEDFSDQEVVQRALRGEVGALRTRGVDGADIVAGFAPVPGTAWALITQENWGALTGGFRAYQRFLLLLLALGVAIPAIVVTYSIRRITKPIGDLIEAAQQVARGNFGQTISAKTGDEVEELALQFNSMSSELAASYANLEKRVASRTRELQAINAISAVVSRSLDLDEILGSALEKSLEVMGVEAGGIYLLEPGESVLRLAAQRGFAPEVAAGIDHLAVGEGFSGRVVASGRALIVNNVAEDKRLTRTVVRDAGFRAVASFPLVSSAEVLGSVFVLTHQERAFSDQDASLLTAIGQQIGVAVDNARLFYRSEQHSHELEALYQANQQMHQHLELDQVLQTLTDVAVDVLRSDKSALLCWDETRERLVIAAARGFLPETVRSFSVAPGECMIGNVAQSGSPTILADTRLDSRVSGEMIAQEGLLSLLLIPIMLEGTVFGVFLAGALRPDAFRMEERRLFEALVQRAALAIENAQLYEQAQELAAVQERQRLARDLHDAVTQTLFSASLIAEVLPRIWVRSQEQGRQRLDELRELTRGALAEMRTLLLELRPSALDDALFSDLLHQLAEATTGRARVPVEVEVENEEKCPIPSPVKIALYRIAQEALNNTAKHAEASRAWVRLLCHSGRLELQISDDGKGFQPGSVGAEHLGLSIMEERAAAIDASLTIESVPGQGSRVRCIWPAHPPRDRSEG